MPSKKSSATTRKSAAGKAAPKKTAAKKKAPAARKTSTKAAAKKAPAKKTPARTARQKTTTTAPAKKAQAKKAPAKPMAKSPFGAKFIGEQKAILESERERYLRSAITWKAEADELMESREPGDVQFDEESGEGDSLAVERERDLVLSARARDTIDHIDEALKRIADGVYGVCVISGKAIPKERLQAIPWAAERVECKVGTFGRR